MPSAQLPPEPSLPSPGLAAPAARSPHPSTVRTLSRAACGLPAPGGQATSWGQLGGPPKRGPRAAAPLGAYDTHRPSPSREWLSGQGGANAPPPPTSPERLHPPAPPATPSRPGLPASGVFPRTANSFWLKTFGFKIKPKLFGGEALINTAGLWRLNSESSWSPPSRLPAAEAPPHRRRAPGSSSSRQQRAAAPAARPKPGRAGQDRVQSAAALCQARSGPLLR